MKENTSHWITRHSRSGKGVESSPGLSPEGVEMAKERAEKIAQLVIDSEEGSVIFYGGITSTPRTRSTAEIYVNGVKDALNERGVADEIRFVAKEDLRKDANEMGYLKTATGLAEEINQTPSQKVVIELPLFLKEFSMEPYFYEEDGITVKPEWQALLDKHGKEYSEAVKDWFSNEKLSEGVSPQEVAEGCVKSMQRLDNFARKFFPNRPLKIGFVGHSFLVDAMLTYMTNKGEITKEGFEKLGGDVIQETELATIDFTGNGEAVLHYRNNDYPIELGEGQS
jgi:hypothetical protein